MTAVLPLLIDIGANLTHSAFAPDLGDVLERAHTHGVGELLVTGASRQGSADALALAQRHSGRLYATAGVHPHHANEYTEEADRELRALLQHDAVKAVGETGLDYHRDLSPRPAQRRAFERQLQTAVDCGKPLFLHQRDAHADFMSMLKSVRDQVSRAVVHCFTGTREELYDYLDLDCHIGITGWLCDERRGAHLRALVQDIPADRLMIETDSPYLLPRTLRPMPSHRRNEPAFLMHIAQELAKDRGQSLAEVAIATRTCSLAFFDLPGASAMRDFATIGELS
ncbi:MAG: TatD family hydrolase [Xanthomonadales bacterium]|nr:TatD family hydrolase [Xanthomonadales bacterium]